LQTGEVPKPPSWVFLSIVGGAASGRNQVTMAHVAPDEMLITSKPIPASEGAPPAKATTLAYRREPTPP
jgi:hypothetical protein